MSERINIYILFYFYFVSDIITSLFFFIYNNISIIFRNFANFSLTKNLKTSFAFIILRKFYILPEANISPNDPSVYNTPTRGRCLGENKGQTAYAVLSECISPEQSDGLRRVARPINLSSVPPPAYWSWLCCAILFRNMEN